MSKTKCLLSTGTFFRISKDMNEAINYANQFNIDGVELGFLFFEELENTVLDQETISILKKFNYNSFHAPGDKKIRYKDNEFFNKIVKKIKKLASLTNCRNITIHAEQIEDFNFVISTFSGDFNLCIENVRPKDGFDNDKLIELLINNPKLYFTFDTAHAMEFSIDEFKNLYKKMKHKVKQIHLSLTHNNRFHNFVNNCPNNTFIEALEIIKDSKCPIVIEAGLRDGFDKELIEKEIKFVKTFFN
jgi:hypothetical protein